MNQPIDLNDAEEQQAINQSARDLLMEFSESPHLQATLLRASAMLITAYAFESPLPHDKAKSLLNDLRTEVAELLAITLQIAVGGDLPVKSPSCRKCGGACDPEWGCDQNL